MVNLRCVFLPWCYVWALYGPDEPAMATPSTPVATAKTPTKRVQVRVCFLCSKNVATTSTYYKVDQDTARRKDSRRNLGRRFSDALDVEDIVDCAFRAGLGAVDHHLYACNACCLKLDTLESAAQIKKDMIVAFTQMCHKVDSEIQVQRQKRLAMDGPSAIVGSSKKPSKRVTAAARALDPRPPRSLFANIGNISSYPASDQNVPGTKARQTLAPKVHKQQQPQEHEKQLSSASVSATPTVPLLPPPLPPQLDPLEISDVHVRV